MKLAVLVLAVVPAAPSVPKQVSATDRVCFTVRFEVDAASGSPVLEAAEKVYRRRLGSRAAESKFSAKPELGEISIELPLRSAFDALPKQKVAKRVAVDATSIELDGGADLATPGLACIGQEWIVFSRLEDHTLADVARGRLRTQAAEHPAETSIELFTIDRMEMLVGARGELAFLQAATEEFLKEKGTTLEAERERLQSWAKWHTDAPLTKFDALERDKGGPLPGTIWRRHRSTGVPDQELHTETLLLLPVDARTRFTEEDVAKYGRTRDAIGYPAVSFELKTERAKDFSAWTERILGTGMAVVFDDGILVLATVRSKLPGGGVIGGGSGGFTEGQVSALIALLQTPKLPSQPVPTRTELRR